MFWRTAVKRENVAFCSSRQEQSEIRSRDSYMGRRNLLKAATALGLASVGVLGNPISQEFLGVSWTKKVFAEPSAAFQYDGNAAAIWADKYAISSGTDYSQQTQGGDYESLILWKPWEGDDDCTNFISNAMFQGGFPMDTQWYSRRDSKGNWQNGNAGFHPWTVATDLYNYLLYETGYGQLLGLPLLGPQKGSHQMKPLQRSI